MGIGAWLREDISLHHADIPVLLCCAVSGLADSCAFNAGGVFVSMQTGMPSLPSCILCRDSHTAGVHVR